MVDGELLACGRTAQLVAAAFEPPPLLDPELPEPGFEPFAFGVALGFASALGFAELPESLDLPSPDLPSLALAPDVSDVVARIPLFP